MPGNGFGDRHGLKARLVLQACVEPAEEFPARLGVILPGIFAVEDDRHDDVFAFIENGLGSVFNVVDEMMRGLFRGHAGIDKPNQVGDGVIAEDHVHLGLAVLEAMNGVEFFGQFRGEATVAIAGKPHSQTASQNAFVGRHPAHAEALGDAENLLRDTAFGRPNSLRSQTEDLLMQVESALQLFAGVFGMAESALRQRQSGARDGAQLVSQTSGRMGW